ncbi:MAG TPA: hypothetical protein VF994_00870 [Myxococcales bacterium]
MRRPSILDVLRAVRDVGPTYPEVRAWWYAPGRRLRLQGTVAGEEGGEAVEVVVETDAGGADLAGIGGDLADRLRRGPVSVRPHRGTGEERQLYRLLSRGDVVTVS